MRRTKSVELVAGGDKYTKHKKNALCYLFVQYPKITNSGVVCSGHVWLKKVMASLGYATISPINRDSAPTAPRLRLCLVYYKQQKIKTFSRVFHIDQRPHLTMNSKVVFVCFCSCWKKLASIPLEKLREKQIKTQRVDMGDKVLWIDHATKSTFLLHNQE